MGFILLIIKLTQYKNKTMSQVKTKNIYLSSNLEPPKVEKLKRGTRVQFVNQDLKEAIKQMKQTMKNKSKYNLGTNSARDQQTNPQKNGEGPSQSEHMFMTQAYKKKMETRLFQIEERKKQLNAKSLEKQMKARLLRKIEENTQLKQKMDLLKDLQERRQLLILQKAQRQKKRKEQEKLLHESSIINAEMHRKSKKKTLKLQLKDSRLVEQESLKDLKFKNYLTEKEKQERQMMLNSRLQFMIRTKSVVGLRGELLSSRSHRNSTISTSRQIKTSQLTRRNMKQSKNEEELIIQQYTHRKQADQQSENQSETQSKQPKTQKKYNTAVRPAQNASEERKNSETNSKIQPENENEQENLKTEHL